jgi:mercuric ion transport protein
MSTSSTDNFGQTPGGGKALIAGGVSALLASACCLGPLVLIMLGISGAWIGSLTLLEPYQPLFVGAAAIALVFAGRRIWRPAAVCDTDRVCARPVVNRSYKVLFVLVVLLLGTSLAFPWIAHWFY